MAEYIVGGVLLAIALGGKALIKKFFRNYRDEDDVDDEERAPETYRSLVYDTSDEDSEKEKRRILSRRDDW